ncbi:hypothetical protein EP51_44290 (plasmid) [Rhodococcus opacus]|uniref:Uncharacterized protein n=1 Tax=Rhodococcus opacus TaxID=37919 RepID=A0A076F082_RHOOP|nr:hypothetical protein EP51_44290 [Rhodococcus opacus]
MLVGVEISSSLLLKVAEEGLQGGDKPAELGHQCGAISHHCLAHASSWIFTLTGSSRWEVPMLERVQVVVLELIELVDWVIENREHFRTSDQVDQRHRLTRKSP